MSNPEYSTRIPEVQSQDKAKEVAPKIPSSVPKDSSNPIESESDSPIGVEHFGIKYWPEIILTPELDYYKIVDKIMFIEDFINNRIKEDGLNEGRDSYLAIVKSMEEELGITPNHEPHIRVDKIFNLLTLMKSNSYSKEKKRIISLLKRNK